MAHRKSRSMRGIEPDSVRQFYNQFSEQRFTQYTSNNNVRLNKAIDRILPYITEDSKVLEIGCGIGIVTERIASVAKEGVIWACDLSENAIKHAKKRVFAPNVRFCVCDVVGDFQKLKSFFSIAILILAFLVRQVLFVALKLNC